MEKKDGTGTCYKRTSKKGTTYYNGKFSLDGKDYWLKLFSSKTQDGESCVSFIIDKREPMEQKEEKPEVTAEDYQRAKEGWDDPIDDTKIPF